MLRGGRLLAVAALCALAFACAKQYGETDTPKGDDDDDTTSQKNQPTTTVTNDSGPPAAVDSGQAVDAGPTACTTCPCAVPASTPTLPQPASLPGFPCTTADINLYLAGEGKPFDDAKAAMAAQNANCAACVFTHQTDTTWGPVVKTNDGRRFVSFGTCYIADGARQQCADGWHAFEWCRQQVCNICLDGENPTDCFSDAKTLKCADLFNAASTNCNNSDLDIVSGSDCAGSGDVVKFLCGPNSH